MNRSRTIFTAAVLAITLLIIGYLGGRLQASTPAASSSASTSAAGGKTILYWYDTMVPAQHFPKPGLSPMGMQMVPKYADPQAPKVGVRIDAGTMQNLGIRTRLVERRVLASTLQVPATIAWDLRKAAVISARVDAVVSQLDVRAPYTRVAIGEPLAALLAPQWSSALAEYAALEQAQSSDAKALLPAARARLRVLGLTPADIASATAGPPAMRESRTAIVLHSPQAGVITTLDVREGQRVSAGQTLMTLNGLSSVWIEAALPQSAAASIGAGTPVTVTVDALPGRDFSGAVEALLPDIDAVTRTQRARIVLANPDGALSPGMFATVRLNPARGKAVPVVPDDAVISTGRQTRVIVAEEDGHFRAVPVRLGAAAGGYTEIRDGLSGGEKVVVSGQFLIDSEASLSGALERLNSGPPLPANASSAPLTDQPTDQPMSQQP